MLTNYQPTPYNIPDKQGLIHFNITQDVWMIREWWET